MKSQKLNMTVGEFWLLFFVGMFMGAFFMFLLQNPLVKSNYVQPETNLSFINPDNTREFCISRDYEGGYVTTNYLPARVSIACYFSINHGYITDEFTLDDLRAWVVSKR